MNGPAHIFYEAGTYGADVELFFVSLSNHTEVESSAGLHFSQLIPYHQFELSTHDFVFIPGLEFQVLRDPHFLHACQDFFAWLQEQHAQGTNICSICTGAFLLAEAGILNGKSCTTHWKYYAAFCQRYPEIEFKKNRLFVVNDHVYSSAGVSSGIDLALYILEEQFGAKLATDVAKEVVIYFRRGGSDPQLSVFLQYRNHIDTRIHDAQDYMVQHIPTPFTLQDVAEHVHMSRRNFTRLFKKTTGITVGAYLEKLRIERAVQLLSNGDKVDYVTRQCGLKSSNQLRTLLKKHKGVLPTDIASLP